MHVAGIITLDRLCPFEQTTGDDDGDECARRLARIRDNTR
jgi:hypothetical protein